jgi:hypothetical protein
MTKSKLTPEEEMKNWYDGKLNLNIKACSDKELLDYYKVCLDSGYFLQCNILRQEMIDYRGMCGCDSPIPAPIYKKICETLTVDSLVKYIETYKGRDGDDGCDLFKIIDDSGSIYFSWGSNKIEDEDWCCKIDPKTKTVDFGFGFDDIFTLENDGVEILNIVYSDIFGN